jgi:adenylate cyclase
MSFALEELRNCFEGAIPCALATSATDGTPNVAYLSQVQYVDAQHVALTFQFFNKTRANILANPYATLCVTDPGTAVSYRLAIQYLRTETDGKLFEVMRAKLSGIAAHTGMADVFRLLGADIYRVLAVERLPGPSLAPPKPRPPLLSMLRRGSEKLNSCCDLDSLIGATLGVLCEDFDIRHAMILLHDEARDCLYTVASSGYETAGIGSEIPIGYGVIGIAAREQVPIRIAHMTHEYGYGKAVRTRMEQIGLTGALETAIPMPGIKECRSQMAIPVLLAQRLLGVLYVESEEDLRFGYDDEDALLILANHFAVAVQTFADAAEPCDAESFVPDMASAQIQSGNTLRVRYFRRDHSLFIDDVYLIKGVAGAILWHLLRGYQQGRSHFSNRELRLAPDLGLPSLSDNLETRLVLLKRRLDERQYGVAIQKTGRGVFSLQVDRELLLDEAG